MIRSAAAVLLLLIAATAAQGEVVFRRLNARLDTGSLAGTTFPVSFSYDSSQVSPSGDSYVQLTSFDFTLLGVQFTRNDIFQGGQAVFHDGVINNVTASFQVILPPNSPVSNITFGFGGPGVIGYADLKNQFGDGSFTIVLAQAQIPDSVIPFLDLKCYGITDPNGGPLPPLNFPLHLDHLNPLFQQLQIPPEDVVLLDPFQLCVPVAKNGLIPPPPATDYIQWIDLVCYNMQTDPTPLGQPLVLTHLNPILQPFPPEFVIVQDPQKMCVPVAKSLPDGTPFFPPPPILMSIQYIDQKGYGITDANGNPLPSLGFPIHLDHLNPVLLQEGAPPEDVLMDVPQQLTVPVAKNGMLPSAVDLPVISMIDEKCYALLDPTTGGPPAPLGLPQLLWQLNPVMTTLPPTKVIIQEPQQLCVPVAKSLPGTQPSKKK